MVILESIFHQILMDCPSVPPETGGLLGGNGQMVSCAVFDKSVPIMKKAQYIPDTIFLNQVLMEWAQSGIEFLGMFHSHPVGATKLSGQDEIYISEILQSLPENQTFWFPIVIPKIEIHAFAVHRAGSQIFIKKDAIIQKERFGILKGRW